MEGIYKPKKAVINYELLSENVITHTLTSPLSVGDKARERGVKSVVLMNCPII